MGFNGGDPIVKRKFKAIKKEYSSLNELDKEKFLNNIKQLFDAGVGV